MFKWKRGVFYCTRSHLENYSLPLQSANFTPGFSSEGLQSTRGHAYSTKIDEACHIIISLCQGKVTGSSPAEAKFPAFSLLKRKPGAGQGQRGPFYPAMPIAAGSAWRRAARQHTAKSTGTAKHPHLGSKECEGKALEGTNEGQRGKKPELIKTKTCHLAATHRASASRR